MRLIYWNPNDERISVGGYNGNHRDNNIRLGAFGTVLETSLGPVIGVFFNYGHIPSMRGTIHSKAQVQSCGNVVCDTHSQFGGKQQVIADGYRIPLVFKDALAYMRQRLPTNKEMHTLPHVIKTN